MPPSYINLAKELRISEVALWKVRRRYPWLEEWCNTIALADTVYLHGLVRRRTAMLAIQGSATHAEIFLKDMAGAYAKPTDPAPGSAINNGFVINNLIPRPEALPMPSDDGGRLRLPPPDSVSVVDVSGPAGATLPPMPANVPVVNVRAPR